MVGRIKEEEEEGGLPREGTAQTNTPNTRQTHPPSSLGGLGVTSTSMSWPRRAEALNRNPSRRSTACRCFPPRARWMALSVCVCV